uniref:Immunoglobulin V-set domain-containing protein n=1 Tax=Gasterosteus aculeatus aculeatus TaxID=481459 RepID=A0AAQ4Q5Z0_GASAC
MLFVRLGSLTDMDVPLRVLLILAGLTGQSQGNSICLLSQAYWKGYLCKGYNWNYCTYQVKTNQKISTKFSISDDKIQKIFTVTVNKLTNDDSYYWCAVEINDGPDDGYRFQLSVTTGKSLKAHSSTSSPLHSQKIKLSHYCL